MNRAGSVEDGIKREAHTQLNLEHSDEVKILHNTPQIRSLPLIHPCTRPSVISDLIFFFLFMQAEKQKLEKAKEEGGSLPMDRISDISAHFFPTV